MKYRIKDAYEPLNQHSTIRSTIQEYIESAGSDFFDFNALRGFGKGIIPTEILNQDPVIKQILDNTPCNMGGMVFHMNPWTCYEWHCDGIRGCAINMLIKGQGHTYFGNKINKYLHQIDELVYEPNQLYLFNTTVEHTIINEHQERWMLSIGFDKSEESLDYHELHAMCQSLGLV